MEGNEIVKMMVEQLLDKKTDSIKVEQGMTGKYSFEVKLYNDNLSDPAKQQIAVDNLKAIIKKLHDEFPDEVKTK